MQTRIDKKAEGNHQRTDHCEKDLQTHQGDEKRQQTGQKADDSRKNTETIQHNACPLNPTFVRQFRDRVGRNLPDRIDDETSLASAAVLLTPILNTSAELGHLFLTDPEAFCAELGLTLSPGMLEHLREKVSVHKYFDRKVYDRLKNGGAELQRTIPSLNFALSPKLESYAEPNLKSRLLRKSLPEDMLIPGYATQANLLGVAESLRKPVSPQSDAFGTTASGLSTRGWDVVIQIGDQFYNKAYQDLFVISLALQGLLNGHYEGAVLFFIPFSADWMIDTDNPATRPRVSIHGQTVRIDFHLSGSCRVAGGNRIPLSASVRQEGALVRQQNGSSVQYMASFRNGATTATIEGVADPDTAAFLQLGVVQIVSDYFRRRHPDFPLLAGVPFSPPFVDDRRSQGFLTPGPNGGSVSVAYGESNDPINEMYITQERNTALTISRAAFNYMIESKLPDLPKVKDEISIDTMDVSLRDGHILVSGSGVVETCWCFPNIDFTYAVRVELSIDSCGRLVPRVADADVSSTVGTVFAVLLSFITSSILPIIALVIAEGIFGSIVEEEAQKELKVDDRVTRLLNQTFLYDLVSPFFDQVVVTRNGVVIRGNLAVGEENRRSRPASCNGNNNGAGSGAGAGNTPSSDDLDDEPNRRRPPNTHIP